MIEEDVIDDEIHKQLDLLDATRLDMTRNEPEVATQSTYNQYQYQLQSTGESYRCENVVTKVFSCILF